MKNSFSEIKKKFVSKYTEVNSDNHRTKSTDINILLNRVKVDQQKESRKKIVFSAAISTGLVLFGILIF